MVRLLITNWRSPLSSIATCVMSNPFPPVKVSFKCREVTVTGPRGTLKKSFKHMDLELTKVGKSRIRVDIWFANRKQMACLRTICSHIENMFKGVLYVSVCIWEGLLFSGCH